MGSAARVLHVVALAALGASGCDPVVTLTVTEPAGAAELVRVGGAAVDFAWTYTIDDEDAAGDVEVSVWADKPDSWETYLLGSSELTAGGLRHVVSYLPDGSAVWDSQVFPETPPMGVYEVSAQAWCSGCGVLARAQAPGILVVRGAKFRESTRTFTGASFNRDIWMTTVTASVARIAVVLEEGGRRWVIDRGTIASDLAPVGRVIHFSGADVDGVAIPGGTYRATIELSALDGSQLQVHDGLVVHWSP